MWKPNFSSVGGKLQTGAKGAGKYALNKLIDGLQEPGMTPEQYQELLEDNNLQLIPGTGWQRRDTGAAVDAADATQELRIARAKHNLRHDVAPAFGKGVGYGLATFLGFEILGNSLDVSYVTDLFQPAATAIAAGRGFSKMHHNFGVGLDALCWYAGVRGTIGNVADNLDELSQNIPYVKDIASKGLESLLEVTATPAGLGAAWAGMKNSLRRKGKHLSAQADYAAKIVLMGILGHGIIDEVGKLIPASAYASSLNISDYVPFIGDKVQNALGSYDNLGTALSTLKTDVAKGIGAASAMAIYTKKKLFPSRKGGTFLQRHPNIKEYGKYIALLGALTAGAKYGMNAAEDAVSNSGAPGWVNDGMSVLNPVMTFVPAYITAVKAKNMPKPLKYLAIAGIPAVLAYQGATEIAAAYADYAAAGAAALSTGYHALFKPGKDKRMQKQMYKQLKQNR